jgi:hypothetical protein
MCDGTRASEQWVGPLALAGFDLGTRRPISRLLLQEDRTDIWAAMLLPIWSESAPQRLFGQAPNCKRWEPQLFALRFDHLVNDGQQGVRDH